MLLRSTGLFSRFFDAERDVTLLMPEVLPAECPIVFCADGQALSAMAGHVTEAIQTGRMPAAILVGFHSSAPYRAQEYVPGVDDARFQAHEGFVIEELLPWADNVFARSFAATSRGLVGFSNGSVFAVSMGLKHRELFSVVIAFSIPRCSRRLSPSGRVEGSAQRYYLAAGKREPGFRQNTRDIARDLKRSGLNVLHVERNYGHELAFWTLELPSAIKWGFGEA